MFNVTDLGSLVRGSNQ